jgi:hypothetical protein
LSRNSDRLGTQFDSDTDSPQQLAQNTESNDFSFIVPTEIVDLPSRGALYSQGHPLHGKDSIEIKQMTAKEEDMLTSRSLLKKGVALDRVLSSIIKDKSINADTMLVGDRNAVIIAARISAYGNDYVTKVTCPSCGTAQEYGFDLYKTSVYNGEDITEYGSRTSDGAAFVTKLPRTGLEITFKSLTGADEKRLLDGVEADRKNKRIHERNVTRQLLNMIVAVNGNSTSEAINYVVENLPSVDVRHLRNAYKAASPNVDLTQHFECSECDYESELEVPLTADFFWPNS